MRFKLDENLGSRSARLFPEADHDVETVFQEGLSGASDELVFETCIRENRCLLSLDLDFADIVRFPPHRTVGIAVLRLPKGASLSLLEKFVRDLLSMLDAQPNHRSAFGSSKRVAFAFTRVRRLNRTSLKERRANGNTAAVRRPTGEPVDSVTGT
jgi:predicted nuclease of predicted toxin-antitoxin system